MQAARHAQQQPAAVAALLRGGLLPAPLGAGSASAAVLAVRRTPEAVLLELGRSFARAARVRRPAGSRRCRAGRPPPFGRGPRRSAGTRSRARDHRAPRRRPPAAAGPRRRPRADPRRNRCRCPPRAREGRLELAELGAGDADRLRELGVGRSATEPACQLLALRRKAPGGLMEGPRQAHQRTAIADVALHLAGDRRDGERGELVAAARVAALDGVEEADRARLKQVVELRARAPVTAGERLDEGQIELDQPLPGAGVPTLAVCDQQSTCSRFSYFPIATARRSHPLTGVPGLISGGP